MLGAMGGRGRAFAALAAFVCAAGLASACSSVSYTDGRTVVSARNMDFANLPELAVSYAPSGLDTFLVPVVGLRWSTLGMKYRRKLSYSCITFSRSALLAEAAKVFPSFKNVNLNSWSGPCTDGLNEAGLGLSLQWQLSTEGFKPYNPSSPGPSVDVIDASNYILSQFTSVAAFKAAVAAGFTITWNPLFAPATLLGFKSPFVPCHFGLWDKTGAAVVIEFSPSGMNVYDNPVGVLTNNPLFPEQLTNLAAWQQFAAGPPNNQPPNTPSLHNSVFYPPPGSYNSPDRFTRLAILKQASGWAPWNAASNPISPGYPITRNNPAVITAQGLVNSVYLTKGMDDSGGTGINSTDWTIYQTVRDHTNSLYYYRVANTPLYDVINLKRVDWAALRRRKLVGNVNLVPNPRWARDATSAWRAGHRY